MRTNLGRTNSTRTNNVHYFWTSPIRANAVRANSAPTIFRSVSALTMCFWRAQFERIKRGRNQFGLVFHTNSVRANSVRNHFRASSAWANPIGYVFGNRLVDRSSNEFSLNEFSSCKCVPLSPCDYIEQQCCSGTTETSIGCARMRSRQLRRSLWSRRVIAIVMPACGVGGQTNRGRNLDPDRVCGRSLGPETL